jgi:hypothetical protein
MDLDLIGWIHADRESVIMAVPQGTFGGSKMRVIVFELYQSARPME